jgi:alkanesulfonate monooxygenase SsuD/methylene tetrahydromethanopterin reductase-like flavin-dependent oxidoreductase (luciferase family)
VKFEYLLENGMILVGSPETIVEQIRGFQEAGATQILVAMQLWDIPHEETMKSIELFGREVIPAFRPG